MSQPPTRLPRTLPRALATLGLPVALAALALPAPPPAAAADETPAEPKPAFTEKVEVRLAQYDVVVRDRDGRIVKGLGPSDFRVLENGKELEVVAVDEWGDVKETTARVGAPEPGVELEKGATPAPAPAAERPLVEKRSIVLLFDNLSCDSALRVVQAKRAAKAFVRDNLHEGDIAAVYELNLSLRPISGFSSNPPDVEDAIDDVVWMPTNSMADDIAESVLAYRSQAGKDYMQPRLERAALLQQQQVDWLREHFYRSLATFGQVFEGLPGKRILVLLSGGFPMTTPGDVSREQGGFTPEFQRLIRALSRAGVTVYSIDLGADNTFGDASKMIDWRVAVGKLGMDENILSDIGLDTAMTSGSAGMRRQVLGVLAGETGGRLLAHGDLRQAFDVINEESTHFYRVSCEVPVAESGRAKYRRLTIRVDRPGAKVTSRAGRYDDVVPTAPQRDPGAAAGFDLADYRSIPLRGVARPIPSAKDDGDRPILAVVEALGPLDYDVLPDGGAKLQMDFHLVARAGDEVVRHFSRTLDARVKPDGLAALRRAFRVEGALEPLPPGVYDLQATLRIEKPPQYGSWTERLIVPPPPAAGGLTFAQVVLAPGAAEASPLLLQPERPAGTPDPVAVGAGACVLPATEPRYTPQDQVVALFWIRGLEPGPDGPPKFDLGVHVLDGDGREHALRTGLLAFQPAGDHLHRGVVGVDLSTLDPGAYVLELQAKDADARVATVRAGFRVEPAPAAAAPAPPAS